MRIAQVSHNYLPHIGGIEFYIKRLISNLEEEGIVPEVLTTDFRTSKKGRKKEAEYFRTSFVFMRNPFSLDLIKHLKKNNYDVFHLHNVWFLPCLIAVYFRKNARIITTMHGVYPDNVDLKLKFFLNLYKPFARYILKKSEKVIVLSNSEKEKLKKIFKVPSGKIAVIPNGINIEIYKAQLRENIILFTGRIIPHKNPDLLIKAVAMLNRKLKDFKVVFVGPIEERYKKDLILLAKRLGILNEIHFLGQLDQSNIQEKRELMSLYQKSRVFVSLGSWEGMPTRIMEAMQFKTPAIAYAAGGSSELIKDKINGLVIEELDEVILASKLESILLNESYANLMGEEARRTIERGFDWNNIFKKILEVYKG